MFCDFGPIFEEWEADFGRTFVLGENPVKIALRDALPVVWAAGREWFQQFGGTIAGHLVGQFPHEKISGNDVEAHIMPGSDKPMRRPDAAGLRCHWILEVHLVDAGRQIGGFHEKLLDIGAGSPA